MNLEQILDKDMFCLCDDKGKWQAMTLAHTMDACIAIISFMHLKDASPSYDVLCVTGFKIYPVKLSIVLNTI